MHLKRQIDEGMQDLKQRANKARDSLVNALPNWIRNTLGSPKSGEESFYLEGKTTPQSDKWKLAMSHPKLLSFNHHGRVDFSLEESLFESSYISAISSHMSYWADIDIAAFLAVEIGGLPLKPIASPK